MKILVTGGAGYIGSHVVKALGEKGHEVLTYDNLSTGHGWAVLYGGLVEADLADGEALNAVFEDFRPEAVMHFAASIEVGESVMDPLKYYLNNSCNTLRLLNAMRRNNVDKFIFSSTAAVYGTPDNVPITEDEPLNPINPYGQSKTVVEKALVDVSKAEGLGYVSLRYFNAAGADPEGRVGERHTPESHLIPIILQAARKERDSIKIFGTDYPTPDGTCIRDYIHVDDLANAHLLALEHLMADGGSEVFNCGYGYGHSVREVVETVKKVTGVDFRVEEVERRAGDPPVLVADSSKMKQTLNWKPRFESLEYIVKTALQWEESTGSTR